MVAMLRSRFLPLPVQGARPTSRTRDDHIRAVDPDLVLRQTGVRWPGDYLPARNLEEGRVQHTGDHVFEKRSVTRCKSDSLVRAEVAEGVQLAPEVNDSDVPAIERDGMHHTRWEVCQPPDAL